MMEITWGVEGGPPPCLKACIDGPRSRDLMRCFYEELEEGQVLCAALEDRWYDDADNIVEDDLANYTNAGDDQDNNTIADDAIMTNSNDDNDLARLADVYNNNKNNNNNNNNYNNSNDKNNNSNKPILPVTRSVISSQAMNSNSNNYTMPVIVPLVSTQATSINKEVAHGSAVDRRKRCSCAAGSNDIYNNNNIGRYGEVYACGHFSSPPFPSFLFSFSCDSGVDWGDGREGQPNGVLSKQEGGVGVWGVG
ncbi:hypothetical protein CBR_g11040 [Chara braunii]|uniref:Uncharacterized protein n=1 Tax=Chara braunii TaxID=69332 RepID=A0A388KQ00_CHABU|nr:hypothetical protein CBR_g11040 [Chara braunii]|eukprot:GBG72107.1 hypothetical protein CBR_g11040 [Chara braunii]